MTASHALCAQEAYEEVRGPATGQCTLPFGYDERRGLHTQKQGEDEITLISGQILISP